MNTVLQNQNLPERSLDVLFGREDVRKTLIRAWLDEGRDAMGPTPTTVRDALHKRLDWNTPVLDKLPEVGPIAIFIQYPDGCMPGICPPGYTHESRTVNRFQSCDGAPSSCCTHGMSPCASRRVRSTSARITDQSSLTGSKQTTWYTQRAALATIYAAAGQSISPSSYWRLTDTA